MHGYAFQSKRKNISEDGYERISDAPWTSEHGKLFL